MKRSSFSLPDSVYDDLSYVVDRMGVSRSSIVSEMLGASLAPLSSLLRSIPEKPTQNDALRLRGESAKVIREKLDSLRDMTDDLLTPGRMLDDCADRPSGCSCDYSTGERVAPSHGCIVHGGRDDG